MAKNGVQVGLLAWLIGVIFLFWIQPIYVVLFSVAMLGLGAIVYMIENRGRL
ncbi:MAG: hypothetical protein Q9P01_14065 [Anaerolineae bacterium]|nr:hypothetical protein [Anaerolineae bacterium]MDQ7035907.1 hypothetical protein [Anaerolineae bacterium]